MGKQNAREAADGAATFGDAVVVSISKTGRDLQAATLNGEDGGKAASEEEAPEKTALTEAGGKASAQPVEKGGKTPGGGASGTQELTPEEEREVAQLKAIDAEVRAHEQAHKTAGGRYAGGASYGYTTGPDGRRYATSGEVSIDLSPVPDNPEATVEKERVVERAALAPAQPSGQDRAVYAAASRLEQQAEAEILAEKIKGAKDAVSQTGQSLETNQPSGKFARSFRVIA